MSCLSLSRKLASSPSPRPRASFAESAPLGRSTPLQKQKIRLLCNFFSIRDSPPLFPKSENRPFHGRFTAFSSRYPRFGASEQSLIAKKLQSRPIFCFQAPKTTSNQRYKRDGRGGTVRRYYGQGRRARCCDEVRTAISVATIKQSHGLGNREARFNHSP